MTDAAQDKEQETDWTRVCWTRRFSGVACRKPATWRGPSSEPGTLDSEWRACDEHHLATDLPLEMSHD